jgi:photoactive yellow protein
MRFDELVAKADAISSAPKNADSIDTVTERIQIDELPEEEFDRLPFGAIELDEGGRVLRYNEYESRLSGIKKDRAIGKHFFTELVPCTDVQEFYGRFQQGVARKSLHEEFRYHFAFKRHPIDVTITLFYSPLTKSIWVFVRPV